MSSEIFVGIDVSKSMLDYTWLPDGKAFQTTNNSAGIASLIKQLLAIKPSIIIIEATGGYELTLLKGLQQAALPVKLINPRQVRDFARSLNLLGKTDKLDALLLARFAQSRKLIPDQPKDLEREELACLLKRREQLIAMITMEKGHLEQAYNDIEQDILDNITQLENQLKKLDKEINNKMKNNSSFPKQDKIQQSIPGVGPIVSATLISNLPELGTLNRKKIAALVGVAPFNRDSGKYRGQRHIHAGRSRIRRVLYSAMRAVITCNSTVKNCFNHYRDAGKAYKVAVIACMRKLLTVLNVMVSKTVCWNPDALFI